MENSKNPTVSTQTEMASRMMQIIDHFYKGNKRAFAQAIEHKPGALNYFLPGGEGRKGFPGFEVINKTLNVHPDVSAEWLIRGIGKMLDRKDALLAHVAKNGEAIRLKEVEKDRDKWEALFLECQKNLTNLIAKS
ncbi:hypothetical protein I5M27_03570 [Adhaeribacter sp. BT258]|uniref:XRE family transcriptional regulator n=1 Tax=Adhaeribacter terrigena TaxID=2793070 RepID=A0ABS1C0D2_9BACT|nr:hypothetical protein [Adhaeribacter terrigena]MBK0402048.1 hypothetical protein [Adhaeribacter terrigena]